MVLSRPELLKTLKAKNGLRFSPPVSDESIEQVSIDLRLGRKFTRFKSGLNHIGSLQMDASLWAATDLWDNLEQDEYELDSRGFVLAQTLEAVTIPNNLVGFVEGRSSYARVGISVHVTAPKIDPGFNGTITLEMTNLSPHRIKLRSTHDKPCQLVLMKLTSPLLQGQEYGSKTTHVFSNQNSPIPSKKSSK